MCQGSAYIKGISLGFLANWFLVKKSLSFLLHASSPPSLLFHVQELGLTFSTHQKVLLYLQEWRSRRRRRRLLIKGLILQSRSRHWSKYFRLRFFLGRRVFYKEKSVQDWSQWISVEVGHVCSSVSMNSWSSEVVNIYMHQSNVIWSHIYF